MQSIVDWVMKNWMQVLVSILAIDAALLPLFPDSGLLKKIKDVLGNFVSQPPKPQ